MFETKVSKVKSGCPDYCAYYDQNVSKTLLYTNPRAEKSCMQCKKEGHYANVCFEKHLHLKNVICEYCKKAGHYKNQCLKCYPQIKGQHIKMIFPFSHVLKQQMHLLKHLKEIIKSRGSVISQTSLSDRKRSILCAFLISQMYQDQNFQKVTYVCKKNSQVASVVKVFRQIKASFPNYYHSDSIMRINIQSNLKESQQSQQKQGQQQMEEKQEDKNQIDNSPASQGKQQEKFMLFLDDCLIGQTIKQEKQAQSNNTKNTDKIIQQGNNKQKKKQTKKLNQIYYGQDVKTIRVTSSGRFLKQTVENTTDIKSTNLIFFECNSFDQMFQQSFSCQFNDTIIRRAFIQLQKVEIYLSQEHENWSYKDAIKKSQKAFNLFRDQLISKKKIRVDQDQMIEGVILTSVAILKYLVVYLQAKQYIVQKTKLPASKTSSQFLQQLFNKLLISEKTLLRAISFLQLIETAAKKECRNLKIICDFISNLKNYHKLFDANHKDAFRIFVRPRTNQNPFEIKLRCQDPTVAIEMLLKKCHSLAILQNFAYPKDVTKMLLQHLASNFKIEGPQDSHVSRQSLLALNVTSTPSEDDLTTKYKPQDNQVYGNIVRAFGVFLCDICQQTADGVVAIFPSMSIIAQYKKQWEKKEGIYQKLNHIKRVFEESQYQAENIENISRFKKFCDVGRGAIYLMSCREKMSLYEQLYGHYSKAIVFIGFPSHLHQNEYKEQLNYLNMGITQRHKLDDILKHTTKCLSNLINSSVQGKSIIFTDVGFNDIFVKKWYPFLKNGNLSTAQGLQQLRDFNRKNSKQMTSIIKQQVVRKENLSSYKNMQIE